MNVFQRMQAQRARIATKAAPNQVSPAINDSYTQYLEGSLRPFLERFRSKAPSMVYYDKIAQCQNYAGAIYLPIAFAATQLSRSKMLIYQLNDDENDLDGKRLVPRSNRAMYRMFDRHPNPVNTFDQILYSMSQQYDLCGECYVWFPPEDSDGYYTEHGEPSEMYVIPSAWVTGMPYGPYFQDGYYQVTPYLTQYPGGNGAYGSVYIPAGQMMRLFDPNPLLDRTAMSVLQAISQSVDTVRSIDQGRASAQVNGCQQNLAFELDPQFWLQGGAADIERVKAQFAKVYAGARNAGKNLVLPPGVKPTKISTAPEDMAWTEGWTQLTDFVFACYQTNRAALGLSGDLNFATLYAAIKQVYWSKLQPRCEQFSIRFTKDYFDPYIGEDYFCELKLPPMEDTQQKLAKWAVLAQTKGGTYSEMRLDLDLPVDPEKMPWMMDRVSSGSATKEGAGGIAGGETGLNEDEDDTEKVRIRNSDGLGSRHAVGGAGIDEGKLFDVFEKQLTRGTVKNGKH
jgi:hypothetical protein